METLQGKTAVVTGAASGMGRAMALRFAGAGMNVVLADLNQAGLDAVAAEVEDLGAGALAKRTDVADAEANLELLDATIDRFGQANLVCLNAGVTGSVGRSWTLSEADWRWSLGILLDGVIFGIKAFVGHLVAHDDGHVVITASIAGHIASPYSGPYAAAKHAVVALSETLALELRGDDSSVGVTCLCPGFVNTDIVAAARARATQEPGSTKDERGDRWMDISERALGAGLAPEAVADMVHDAVLANQFWLFTDNAWDAAITKRTSQIVGRLPPSAGLPTKSSAE